jgi:hypothetical protein
LLSALISGLLLSGLLEIFLSGLLFFRVGIAPVVINVQLVKFLPIEKITLV